MTAFSAPELAAVAVTITLAYTVFGFGGFGANLVALPLLVHVMSLRFAVPLLLLLDLCSAGLMGLKNRPLIETAELLRLLPWLLAGMVLGLLVLQHADEYGLLLLLGAFVLGYALWNLFGHDDPVPVSPHWAVPAGLVGGVFSTMFGTGGPAYTLYLARRLQDTRRLRATLGVLILGSAVVRLALFTGSGFLGQPGLLQLALLLVPCSLAGYLIGTRLQARLPQAQVRRGIWALLVLSGSSLIARGLIGG